MWCLLLVAVLCVGAVDVEISKVTSGSVIKLKNQQFGGHLHSHKVNYGGQGGSSGQQSVTGYGPDSDENDYWLIQAFNAETKSAHVQGRPIAKGDIVLLRHMATNTWLHSHHHTSPLSNNQEVSAYQFKDDSNFWEVQNDMIRGEPVRLKHISTGKFLAMMPQRYGHPIPNQNEVAGVGAPGPNTVWITTHGIYFEPNVEHE